MLYHHVSGVERQSLTTRGYPLVLSCKTFQQLYFIIPRESDILDIIHTIHMFAQPSEWREGGREGGVVKLSDVLTLVVALSPYPEVYSELYAFQYRPASSTVKQRSGWMLYEAEVEFKRMGVPNDHWQATKLNHNYEVSVSSLLSLSLSPSLSPAV